MNIKNSTKWFSANLLFLFLLSGYFASGQKILISKPLENLNYLPSGTKNRQLEVIDDDSFVMYYPREGREDLVRFNNRLEEQFSIDITSESHNKLSVSLGPIPLTKTSYLPSIAYQKASGTLHNFQYYNKGNNLVCIHSVYDGSTGEERGSSVVMDTTLRNNDFPFTSFSDNRAYFILSSPKDAKKLHRVTMYNFQDQQLGQWSKELEKHEVIEDVLLTDDGQVLLLTFKEDADSFHLTIYSREKATQNIEIPLQLDGSQHYSPELFSMSADRVIIAGVKMERGQVLPTAGIKTKIGEFLSVDLIDVHLKTGEYTIHHGREFTKQYKKSLYDAIRSEQGEKKYSPPKKYSYVLNNFHSRNDSLFFILENLYSISSGTGNGTYWSTETYWSDDLLVVAFDANGTNIWNQVIPKRLASSHNTGTKSDVYAYTGLSEKGLFVLSPGAHKVQRTLLFRSLDLATGSYEAPVDLLPDLSGQKYYLNGLTRQLSPNTLLFNYLRIGMRASKRGVFFGILEP